MQIISLGDNLQEMSNPIFLEKGKKISLSSTEFMVKGLRKKEIYYFTEWFLGDKVRFFSNILLWHPSESF